MPSPPPTTPDGTLLARYLSGDRKGAEAIFARYGASLLVYLRRRLGRRDLAEDGLQETFCRLLESAGRLVHHPKLEAWIFAVARNICADAYRLRRRAEAAADRAPNLARGASRFCESEANGPDRNLERLELNRILRRVITEMPPPEREVFLLRTERALPFRAISEQTGAPLNTVLSRMHRALKRVRRALIDEGWIGAPRGRRVE